MLVAESTGFVKSPPLHIRGLVEKSGAGRSASATEREISLSRCRVKLKTPGMPSLTEMDWVASRGRDGLHSAGQRRARSGPGADLRPVFPKATHCQPSALLLLLWNSHLDGI